MSIAWAVNPIFFGRTRQNRFDDPLGEFGVLYAAEDAYGAFAETFGDFAALSVNSLTVSGYSRIRLERPPRGLARKRTASH